MDITYRYDPRAPSSRIFPTSPEDALQRLSTGNQHFADVVGKLQNAAMTEHTSEPLIIPVSPLSMGFPLADGCIPNQRPFAIVLGCSDARVPVEILFDCSANEIFTVRVAGNVLGLECLGSVDYAVTQLSDSLRAATVLGHTGCGAVTAAVDLYLSPDAFMNVAHSHAVRSLVDRILLAVRGASRALDRVSGSKAHQAPEYREQLIAASIYMNAAVTAFDLRREIQSISGQQLAIVFSVYDVVRSRVSALPFHDGHPAPPTFLTAPECPETLANLATQVVQRLIS